MSIAALATLTLLAWVYLLSGAGMDRMAMMPMEAGASDASYLLVTAMWASMMIAMMIPSAAPTILLYARVHRHAEGPSPATAAFLAGYLACWLAFALAAAALQLLLERNALASPTTMALHGGAAAAGVLIAAGLYQLSPLKDACLSRCRSPAEFLTRHYRPGALGALRLGLLHGAYCVGCCWVLMVLLFVGGVMNIAWIAALTLLVAAEKLLPGGPWIARLAGVTLIGWGVALLVT